ncbi:MAG: hypothetical protein LBQ35_07450 [Spirochaetaceae bacterium]|nr:hypothetical protein [Spirochaetaceae bacterium]
MQAFFRRFFAVLFLAALPAAGLFASEPRKAALDIYLVVRPQPGEEAAVWLCDYLLDRVLQEGDRLCVWSAGPAASRLFEGTFAGAETRTRLSELFLGLPGGTGPAYGTPDYAGALREAAAMLRGRNDSIPCVLVITGKDALPGTAARSLRFSRIEEFPSFRVITAALGIEAEVRRAAAAFME